MFVHIWLVAREKIYYNMALVSFGYRVDMNTIAPPTDPAGYIVAYDLDGILKQKNHLGVISLVGSGAGGPQGATGSQGDSYWSATGSNIINNSGASNSVVIVNNSAGGTYDLAFKTATFIDYSSQSGFGVYNGGNVGGSYFYGSWFNTPTGGGLQDFSGYTKFYINPGDPYNWISNQPINIGTGTASNSRFLVSSSGGTNSLIVSENGNVGIGITSPSNKLHVYATQSGAFRLQDGAQGNGYILTSDSNGVASWTSSVYATKLNLYDEAADDYKSIICYDSIFSFRNAIDVPVLQIEDGVIKLFKSSNDKIASISPELITNNQSYTLPDESGTIALRKYKVYTALVTQNGTSGNYPIGIGSGELTIGVTYRIDDNSDGLDMTNVGAPNNNSDTFFVATGVDPNSWGSGTLYYDTGAPVVNVLENTIGNIWWTYNTTGSYLIFNSNFLFNPEKTVFYSNRTIYHGISDVIIDFLSKDINSFGDYIEVGATIVSDPNILQDGVLVRQFIEIRVYD